MSQRHQMNALDKVRAKDELLNQQLKDAGVWEEGLSVQERQQLLSFIRESENSAKEEEEKRKHYQEQETISNETNIQSSVEIAETSVRTSPQQDDSEPVITFVSSPTAPHQNASKSPVGVTGGTSSKLCLKNKRSFDSGRHKAKSIAEDTPEKQQATEKVVQSLLSNKSITTRYFPGRKTIPEEEDIIVSETDDDEEMCDPLSINDSTADLSKTIDRKREQQFVSKSSASQQSDHQETFHSNTVEVSKNSPDIRSKNFCLDIKAVNKALFHSTYPESSKKNISRECTESRSETLASKCTSSTTDSFKNSGLSHNKLDINHEESEEIKETTDDIIIEDVSNSSTYVTATENIPETVSLKRKDSLRCENQSHIYFKTPFETENICVNRINTLISDWHLALTQYQRKLSTPVRWGAPITIDRQIKNNSLKRKAFASITNEKNRSLLASTSKLKTTNLDMSSSSEYEFQASEDSDEDFEIFSKRKKVKSYARKPLKTKSVAQKKNVLVNDSEPVSQEEKVITVEKNGDSRNSESEAHLVINKENDSNDDDRTPTEEKSSAESQSLLSGIFNSTVHDPTLSVKAANTTRKSFQLCPIAEMRDDKIPQSPDCFNRQSSTEIDESKNASQAENHEYSPSLSTNNSQPSVAPLGNASTPKRNGVKRKKSPSPFGNPPPKKTANGLCESQENVEIKPVNARIKRFITKKKADDAVNTTIREALSDQHKVKKTDLQNDSPGISVELDSAESSKTTIAESSPEKEDCMPCPLCQAMFSVSEIEVHASACDGAASEPPTPPPKRSQVNRGRRQASHTKEEQDDVYYVETRKHSRR